jgi:ubiquinone/menaquinone biosynthesis C-methylase UbiE
MNCITIRRQKELYNDSKKWEREYHRINIDRAKLTVCAVPRDVKRILDLGSGDGLVLNMLKKAGHDPVAFDISRIALEYTQSDKLVQGTASNLPFFSNSFDCVIACEVLEHIPNLVFESVLKEMERITKKYIIITVPYKENLKINYARCQACGCIFNGAYHVRSFQEDDIKFLFKRFTCIKMNEIVEISNPDRTFSLELFVRHHLAHEYKYYGPSIKCPLCLSSVNQKPDRNWIGWIASGMRYFYRIYVKKKTPLWYLSVYKKFDKTR